MREATPRPGLSTAAQRALLRVLTLGVAFLIAYGSLYPFNFMPHVDVALARQALWGNAGQLWTNFPDVVGNIVLFLPPGLLIAFVAEQRTSRVVLFLTWTLFALLVQIGQFWVPERSASLADVLWNAIGCLCGLVTGLAYRRLDWARGQREMPFEPLAMLVATCWLLAELAPFVPSLDVGQLRSALRPMLNPLDIDVGHGFVVGAQFLVAAFCLQSGVGRYKPAWMVSALAAILLASKLFILGHALHPGTLLGLVAGWAAFLVLSARRHVPWGLLLGLLLSSYLLDSLAPFRLSSWQTDLHWLPFFARLDGSMMANLVSLLRIAFISMSLIWLLRGMQARVLPACLMLAAGFAGIEYLQTWVEGRVGDMTEPFVLLILAWVLRATPMAVPLTGGLSRPSVSSRV